MKEMYIYKGNWPNGIYGLDEVKFKPGIKCPEDKVEWAFNTIKEYGNLQKYLEDLCKV